MEDASKLLKISNRNVQTYGFVYHDTNGPNHGQTKKTQSFLSKGICTVTSGRTILWERQFEKVLFEHGWEKFQTGNVYLSTEPEDSSYQCMWTISNWQARRRTHNRLGGKFSWKTLTWENQHHFLTIYMLVALKESVK